MSAPAGRLFAVLLVSLLFLPACKYAEPPLRVGTNLWIGYDPIYVARNLQVFGEEDIQLVQFSTASESVRAYQNGLVDVAALTGDEVLRVCATMGPQAIFLVCDWSSGADCILGQPEIKSFAQLAGLRVGLETTALGAYMIHRAIDVNGMSIEDIELVHVPLSEHTDALLQRKVDAIVTFEPHKTKLMASGAVKLFDSQDIPEEVIDVLITKPDVLTHKREQLQLLVDSWFHGVDAILRREPDVQRYLAATQEVELQEVDRLLRGIVLTGRSQNIRILKEDSSKLLSTFENVREFMLDSDLVPNLNYMPYVYSDFL